MDSPGPTWQFKIPSLHDGSLLECRIYYHTESHGKSAARDTTCSLAVVAHPYAPLGGCFDDPVVSAIVSALFNQGITVATFNFRGAGRSQGRTSWSGKPERLDYLTVAVLLVRFHTALEFDSSAREGQGTDTLPLRLICAGYSYGSLVALQMEAGSSELPNGLSRALDAMGIGSTREASGKTTELPAEEAETPLDRKAISAIQVQAVKMVRQAQVLEGEIKPDPACDKVSPPEIFRLNVRVSSFYLLVSPVLPPAAAYLLPFSGRSLFSIDAKDYGNLIKNQSFAVFGDEDAFTSHGRLMKWSEMLQSKPGSRFISKTVPSVGHFWREEGALLSLRRSITDWLRDLDWT